VELEDVMNRIVEPVKIADKAASNLLKEIEASKTQSLARLIYALGIRFVGERTGQLLAEHFSSLEELALAKEEKLVEVPEVGPKVASAIAEFFSEEVNRDLIERLRKIGVHPTAEKRQVKSDKFAGKSFVFTGGLANRTREEAGEIVQQHGGKVSESVSKKTDYVVVGTDPGSKYEKAKELGVAILTESEFENLVTGGLAPPEVGASELKREEAPAKGRDRIFRAKVKEPEVKRGARRGAKTKGKNKQKKGKKIAKSKGAKAAANQLALFGLRE
jgi:NAD-dependent DNA ligase